MMDPEALKWTTALAFICGGLVIGMASFVSAVYLRSKPKLPMLLVSSGVCLWAAFVARAIALWGRPSVWFGIAVFGALLIVLGLFAYVVIGPPRQKKNGGTE